jgi:hypothetical protein
MPPSVRAAPDTIWSPAGFPRWPGAIPFGSALGEQPDQEVLPCPTSPSRARLEQAS